MKDTPRVLELRLPSGRRDWEHNSYNSKNGKPNQRLWLKRRKGRGRMHHLFCLKRTHLNPLWNYPCHLGQTRCYEKNTSIFTASFGIPKFTSTYYFPSCDNVWLTRSFDKILEDLDATAGNIAHSHADDNNPGTRPLNIVTASVDRIDLLDKMSPDRDMVLRGGVTYVGKSSMEVWSLIS